MCLRARVVKPMMAFMGVRMSWLMLERKVLLAMLARSAWARAVSSWERCWSSRSMVSVTTRLARTTWEPPASPATRVKLNWMYSTFSRALLRTVTL